MGRNWVDSPSEVKVVREVKLIYRFEALGNREAE